MSFPDYEGKDYYESDHDDEPLNSQELSTSEPKTHRETEPPEIESTIVNKVQDTVATAAPEASAPKEIIISEEGNGDEKRHEHEHGHQRDESTDAGALDDLLDDYNYVSQPNTPGVAPAEFMTNRNPETPMKSSVEEASPLLSTVTNIRKVDPNPGTEEPVSAHNTPAKPSVQPPSTTLEPPPRPAPQPTGLTKSVSATSTNSFVTNVMKAFDETEKPSKLTIDLPSNRTSQDSQQFRPEQSTAESATTTAVDDKRQSRESQTKSPGGDYASSNYWAQMKAQLRTKRTQGDTMSRGSSHKTGEEEPRSSTDSARSNNPRSPKMDSDGRSGSFSSYTPIPRVLGERRPSIPMAGRGRPTIDTNLDTIGQRRGSSSDPKRPTVDTRPGNRSASNSPVIGSMPFSNRPSSRNRNREDEIMGALPVFAPKEPLPGMVGPRSQSPVRQMRPSSPMRPASPARGRPQSPGPIMQGRPQSPITSPVGPARSQSPTVGMRRPQSPMGRMNPAPGPNRTPSPLKDAPVERTVSPPKDAVIEKKEDVARSPSPIKQIAVEFRGPHATPSPAPTPSPTPSALATRPMPPRKPSPVGSHFPPAAATPPPPPVEPSQALSTKPEKSVPPIPVIWTKNPPSGPPSPDPEWATDDDEEDDSVAKRTTVFLQEASKRKETLPPLPAEPPPMPPMYVPPTNEPPTEHALKQTLPPVSIEPPKSITPSPPPISQEPSSPLIPPPSAPVLERVMGTSEAGSDSDDSFDEKPPQKPQLAILAPATVAAAGTIILSANQNEPLTTLSPEHQPSPQPPTDTPVNSPLRKMESPVHQLPELDVSRPITWGPLTFPESESMNRVMGPLEDVKEEENEEESPKVEHPQITREEMLHGPTKMETKEEEEEGSDEDWENVFEPKRASKTPSIPVEPPQPPPPPPPVQIGEVSKPEEVEAPEEATKDPKALVEEPKTIVEPQPEPNPEPEEPPPEPTDEIASLLEDSPAKDKGKEKEIPPPETPMPPSSPASSSIWPHPTPRSKYIDRDITSFVTSEAVIRNRRDSSPPPVPKLTLQTQFEPPAPSIAPPSFTLDRLPHYMNASDIPDMSSAAQRIGAYQSRREQMLKIDTGLRGWLVQVQQKRPSSASMPQVTPPDVRRLSKESGGGQPSPLPASAPFSGGHNVGRKVISKIKVGGKKIGAATKHTIDKLGDMSITGEKRSSQEIRYEQSSPGRGGGSADGKLVYMPESYYAMNKGPVASQSDLPAQGNFAANTHRGPESGSRDDGSPAIGLGLSAPSRPYAAQGGNPSSGSIPAPVQSQTWDERPPTSSPGVVMSKKEAKGHAHSSSMSGGGKPSKFFGSLDYTIKRNSGSSIDNSQQRQSSSPKQKSKFSKFMSDLSHQDITGRNARTVSHSAAMDSRPPPPPDKTQFRSPSGGAVLRNAFTDLNSPDITGARPQDKPKGGRSPTSGSAAVSGERTSSGGFGRFFSDLSKRDIAGRTEEERQAAARQREQENTHIPAEPAAYDESASDWEVKMDRMEDVLPHIPKERLAEALKQAAGDEHRAIGLAVINSR